MNDIYANNNKDKIVEYLNTAEYDKLCLTRIKLYIKLVETFPELEKYEINNRKRKEQLIEDVYEIGYSLNSGEDSEHLKRYLVHRNTLFQYESPENKKSKLCIEDCKFKDGKTSSKKEDVIQCHLCQQWIHPTCVGEKSKDIIGIWTCITCRNIPRIMNKMLNIIQEVKDENHVLKTELLTNVNNLITKQQQKDQEIQDLTKVVSTKSDELTLAMKEIKSLRSAIGELNSQLKGHLWSNFRPQTAQQKATLVVGSSIVRDITESALDNTDISCIPGGGISEAHKKFLSNQVINMTELFWLQVAMIATPEN